RARRAVDEYCTRVSQNRLLHEPYMKGLRQELLQTAVHFFEEFARHHGDDPRIQEGRGAAYSRLANITGALGSRDRAIDLYHQALTIFDGLSRQHPTVAAYQVGLASTRKGLGSLYEEGNQLGQAETNFRLALEVLQRLARARPGV